MKRKHYTTEQIIAILKELVREIQEADLVVLGTPIYNFGVPAGVRRHQGE